VVLRKAGNKAFNSSDKIYMVRNCFKLTVGSGSNLKWKFRIQIRPIRSGSDRIRIHSTGYRNGINLVVVPVRVADPCSFWQIVSWFWFLRIRIHIRIRILLTGSTSCKTERKVLQPIGAGTDLSELICLKCWKQRFFRCLKILNWQKAVKITRLTVPVPGV